MRSDGFTGTCVRDNSVSVPPVSCADGQLSYIQTRGYRKVAGDVCVSGVDSTFEPVMQPCCSAASKWHHVSPSFIILVVF